MLKKKKKVSSASSAIDKPPMRPRFRRFLTRVVMAELIVLVGVAVMLHLESQVTTRIADQADGNYTVRFARTPAWMPPVLARMITASITPRDGDFLSPTLSANVFDLASENPWVKDVKITRKIPASDSFGPVLEVDATFRKPLAAVETDRMLRYVDADGVLLPAFQTPKWAARFPQRDDQPAKDMYFIDDAEIPPGSMYARIHYIIIQGVTVPPPQQGEEWISSDLQSGLKLVKLIWEKDYNYQVRTVDVRNFNGRIASNEPHIRMFAQVGRGSRTDIRFGRFPAARGGDFVISPARKMSYLDRYASEHGGNLAGQNQYIDLRYDQLHVSIN